MSIDPGIKYWLDADGNMMEMKTDKPSEFWITKNRCNLPDRLFYSEDECYHNVYDNDNIYHTIEFSAYEALQKKLKIAVEALRKIQGQSMSMHFDRHSASAWVQDFAREALKKIEGE